MYIHQNIRRNIIFYTIVYNTCTIKVKFIDTDMCVLFCYCKQKERVYCGFFQFHSSLDNICTNKIKFTETMIYEWVFCLLLQKKEFIVSFFFFDFEGDRVWSYTIIYNNICANKVKFTEIMIYVCLLHCCNKDLLRFFFLFDLMPINTLINSYYFQFDVEAHCISCTPTP